MDGRSGPHFPRSTRPDHPGLNSRSTRSASAAGAVSAGHHRAGKFTVQKRDRSADPVGILPAAFAGQPEGPRLPSVLGQRTADGGGNLPARALQACGASPPEGALMVIATRTSCARSGGCTSGHRAGRGRHEQPGPFANHIGLAG